MIRLVGPGGAGKSTAGALLARQLGVTFVDLDQEFKTNVGDISAYLDVHGYDAYAERNVDVYLAITARARPQVVLALSSGFMTYRPDIHRAYASGRRSVASSQSTFVLLPSLDLETCVAEIVRRQTGRPFARSAQREEEVIRARFATYVEIPARKVETMRPVSEVVDELACLVLGPTQEPFKPEGNVIELQSWSR
jgi:shikimate kinase